ncbi:MAG TPA: complex I NDUFA9 subunit family protein [Humisphaera sp.]|nr:complex I NDUFA9 subunit family protein [Humisphaera sp.]
MTQRVLVTGASGFVGTAVVEQLLASHYDITALVHRGDLKPGLESVRVVRGDLFTDSVLDKAVEDCDAVIHLVGIIKEIPRRGITFDRIHVHGAKNVLDAAQRAGIQRIIHMSALGAAAEAPSEYHKTKFMAEHRLRKSTMDWTILQPSLIHGPQGEFTRMLAAWARGKKPPFFFMPYFGGGLLGLSKPTQVQPVYVRDVARAFVDAIDNEQTNHKTLPVCGSQVLTWPQMYKIAAQLFAGKRKPALPIPAWYAKAVASIIPAKLLPFTKDQVQMAESDNTADMSEFAAAFGWEPRAFEETAHDYANEV